METPKYGTLQIIGAANYLEAQNLTDEQYARLKDAQARMAEDIRHQQEAEFVAVTGRISRHEPEMQYMPYRQNTGRRLAGSVTTNGPTGPAAVVDLETPDYSELERRIVGYDLGASDGYTPKPYYTHFEPAGPKPRLEDRGFENRVAKRRAANKRARKARRK